MAISVAAASVLGTKLAVRIGTKVVVACGLVAMAAFYGWVSAVVSATTAYPIIAVQMVLFGIGMGFTSAPATEAIMGAVATVKAGVGSAVNDATRLLGGTLGVAVIGSVYASLYGSRLTGALPTGLPDQIARAARQSVGAALAVAGRLDAAGRPHLGGAVHDAAVVAFIHGLGVGCLVAGGVAVVGAVLAAVLLPAQPTRHPRPYPVGSEHPDVPVRRARRRHRRRVRRSDEVDERGVLTDAVLPGAAAGAAPSVV